MLAIDDKIMAIQIGTGKIFPYENRSEKYRTQLFLEIHYYFIVWGHINKLLWTGDNTKDGKKSLSISDILHDKSFSDAKSSYESKIKEYQQYRNHLEHFLSRLGEGVSNLGNLLETTPGRRFFTFGNEKIDLSDKALSLLDELSNDINLWASSK